MTHEEVSSAIRSQVLTVFFLPLVTACIHTCFAFPIICRMLSLFNMRNTTLLVMYGWMLCGIWYHLCAGVSDDCPDIQSYRTGITEKLFHCVHLTEYAIIENGYIVATMDETV